MYEQTTSEASERLRALKKRARQISCRSFGLGCISKLPAMSGSELGLAVKQGSREAAASRWEPQLISEVSRVQPASPKFTLGEVLGEWFPIGFLGAKALEA